MTKLIVSVRSGAEARIALDGGAHLIDVKEPDRGSLGAADAAAVRAVAAEVGAAAPLSVALGELLEAAAPLSTADLSGASFAKLGLSGCGSLPNWVDRWLERADSLPEGVRPVAVVYADAAAHAPVASAVLSAALSAHAPIVLVDTWDKRGGGLLRHWPLAKVARFVAEARQLGLSVALAGSLDGAAVRRLLALQPDYIAVRTAICRGGRVGRIDGSLVRRLVDLVESGHEPLSASPAGRFAPGHFE